MRAVKYGVTRDYVMGLEIVLADGRILTVGSKNIKDSSGLSLKNLIIGSEGTLAVITKCILKLIPKPQSSLSVVVPYDSLEKGIKSVLAIKNENADPTAIEFVERKLGLIREVTKKHGALDFLVLTDSELSQNVWKIRGALVKAVEAVSEQEPVDIVVPINKTAEFIGYVNELEKEKGKELEK